MPWAAIAAAAANVAGGVIGRASSASDREKAEIAAQRALDEILAIGAPPETAKEIFFQKFQEAGIYTPDMEEAINLGVSEVAQIQEDPQFRDAQLNALQKMGEISETGLRPEDRLVMSQIREKAALDAKAREGDILRNMQERGISGQGAELAARLSSKSASDREQAESSDRLSAMASERALQALGKYGDMSSNIRGQEFDISKAKSGAADEFQRFNVQAAQNREQRRAAEENAARRQNLQRQQQVSDANIGMTNQELLRQRQAAMTDWEAQRGYRRDRSNAYKGEAASRDYQAGQTEKFWKGMGGAGSDAIKGLMPGGGKQGIANVPESAPETMDYSPEYMKARQDLDEFEFKNPYARFNQGGMVYEGGGKVPGRAEVDGNSPKNDKVPALLSPGEIVVPKEESKKLDTAYEFIRDILEKKRK